MATPIDELIIRIEGDVSDLLRRLDEIERRLRDTDDASRNTGAGMGFAFGLAAGAASKLVDVIVQVGAAFTRMLSDVIKGGVELNKQLETTEKVFDAAFGQGMGQEALKFLDEVSKELNISSALARDFAQSILPKSSDLETFTELLRLTDIQADATGKSVGELEFAIREALSGDFVSLKDQFDLSGESIDRIKELGQEIGRDRALAQVLNEEFVKLGKVNISGTLATDFKALEGQFTDLQQKLGVPVFEELKEQVAEIGQIFTDRSGDFELAAGAIGDVAANVVDLVGSGLADFLRNLDTQQVISVANTTFKIIENVRLIAGELKLVELPGELLNSLDFLTTKLNEALTTATQITAIAKAESARAEAQSVARQKLLEEDANFLQALGKGFGAAFLPDDFFLTEKQRRDLGAIGQSAFNDAIMESMKAMEASSERIKENTERQKERQKALEESRTADRGALDAILAENNAMQQNNEEILKLTDKFAGQLLDAQEATAEKSEELQESHQEKLLEIEQDAAQDRLKANQDYNDALLDLAKQSAKDREDALADYDKDIADIEAGANDDRAKLVEDYQREEQRRAEDHFIEMQKLERNYLDSLSDLVGARDARGIVDLRRRHAKEVREKTDNFQRESQRRAEDHALALQQQEEAAQKAREARERQKSEELAEIAEREEERRQQLAEEHAEELTAIDEKEQQARAKEQESFAEKQAALDAALQERLSAIAKNLADTEAVEAESAQKILSILAETFGQGGQIDELMSEFQSRVNAKKKIRIDIETSITETGKGPKSPGASAGFGSNPGTITGKAFAQGGEILATQPTVALFGEAGPELARFTPLAQAGMGSGRKVEVDLKISGSAPPGIRSPEIEQIAMVLNQALNDAGINR